jgi:hypothetical protein
MRRDSSSCGRVLREATHHQLPAVPNSKGQPTVYVSSTFIDLEGHRAALKTALEKARYEVDCMEKYTAFDQRPLLRCLADVAAADVYVLLIAHRYGYRPPENNPQRRSITQLEYEEASRHGKPIKCSSTIRLLYVFVLGDRCVGGRDRCLN